MFNGIVESIGHIAEIVSQNDCVYFAIKTSLNCDDLRIGDSIAVNGVCLTITHCLDQTIFVTAVPETLRVTNLGKLITGSEVNLEKSLAANGRIGGHYVQGHVDGVAEILAVQSDGDQSLIVKFSVPEKLAKYIVNKGYITLDGMSITVIQSHADEFSVTFIPHTQAVTIVKNYRIGTFVNIEVDILGKYIEKILGVYQHANIC